MDQFVPLCGILSTFVLLFFADRALKVRHQRRRYRGQSVYDQQAWRRTQEQAYIATFYDHQQE